jgi:hypothetical protein
MPVHLHPDGLKGTSHIARHLPLPRAPGLQRGIDGVDTDQVLERAGDELRAQGNDHERTLTENRLGQNMPALPFSRNASQNSATRRARIAAFAIRAARRKLEA